jgi:DNA-binding NarL/FixJ family response regulator
MSIDHSLASELRPPTARELEVIELLASGWSNDEIAGRLVISRKTVEFHLTQLYRRYGLACRAELVARAIHANWI